MKGNIYEESFLKQSRLLDNALHKGGQLERLALQIVQSYQDEHISKYYKVLSNLGCAEDKLVVDLVKTSRLSLIQLCGCRGVLDACRRASPAPFVEVDDHETLQDCLDELNRLVGLECV